MSQALVHVVTWLAILLSVAGMSLLSPSSAQAAVTNFPCDGISSMGTSWTAYVSALNSTLAYKDNPNSKMVFARATNNQLWLYATVSGSITITPTSATQATISFGQGTQVGRISPYSGGDGSSGEFYSTAMPSFNVNAVCGYHGATIQRNSGFEEYLFRDYFRYSSHTNSKPTIGEWETSAGSGDPNTNTPTLPDQCPNITGSQAVVPTGYFVYSDGNCYTDACTNIDGNQHAVPDGMTATDGVCTVPVSSGGGGGDITDDDIVTAASVGLTGVISFFIIRAFAYRGA